MRPFVNYAGPGTYFETGSLVTPTASDVLAVDQWVDERTYDRRRQASIRAWNANAAGNGVRDWLEKKTWDVLSTWPDDGTGEVDAACGVPSVLREDPTMELAGLVNSDSPSMLTLNPMVTQLRRPGRQGVPWVAYSNGLYREDANDGFPAIVLHETRHCWQLSLSSWHIAYDTDGDSLFAPSPLFPSTSSDLLDGPNVAAQGVNGDGHFMGDAAGLRDPGTPPAVMHERNAQRYTARLGATTRLDCALSSFSVISGSTQSGPPGQELPEPLVVRVLQKTRDQNGHVSDAAAPGVTLQFRVAQGSTAKVKGGSEAFVMTDDAGLAAVLLENGATDTTVTVTLLPPMTQNQCPLNASQIVVPLYVL